jgi:hypothetical protein
VDMAAPDISIVAKPTAVEHNITIRVDKTPVKHTIAIRVDMPGTIILHTWEDNLYIYIYIWKCDAIRND